MSLNIIAILVSLAMMLTGVGGEGQPAEAARTLVLHNVRITVNDETVDLAPELRLGTSTDGQKAVFDLGVDLNGETLFPIQLGAADGGITALFGKSDVAVNVTANALNALSEQANQMMEAMQSQMAGGENAELMTFLTQEFIPAYAGLIKAVQDPDFAKEIKDQGEAIFAQIVDRGEGTPVTEEIDGTEYALTAYSYTIESAQMAELSDALFTSNETLKNYYDVLFKLYGMMPEESGLNGLTSFKDLFDKTGLAMSLACEEKLSDDGEVEVMDGVLTIDMSGMIANMAAQNGDAETAAPAEIPPMVMNIQSVKVAEGGSTLVTMDYEANDARVAMEIGATIDNDMHGDMNMVMELAQNDERIASIQMNAHTGTAGGGETYDVNYNLDFEQQDTNGYFHAHGIQMPDGTGENTVDFNVSANQMYFGVSFDLDVLGDAIEDKANGREAALVLDDLSQEALNGLGEDQAVQAALMQVTGSIMADAQKLTADESVQKLMSLFAAVSATPADADYADSSFGGEEGEAVEDYEYEEPEDDGVLGYEVPQFTWLPEGWTQKESEVDTQYDWVNMSFSTDDYSNSMYATFYKDEDNIAVNYVVGGDGEIEAVDGREITVSDFGDGNVSVTLREENLFGNLSFFSEGIDVETVGKIVAGIQF